MSQNFKQLIMRIRNEISEIDMILLRSEEGLKRAKDSGDDYYIDGTALNLHGFYSGLERVFELISIHVDDNLPEGENWHQVLLKQMSEEIAGIRPAVISVSVRDDLDEYRGFRHIVRNIYTYKFDAKRIERLVKSARPLFKKLKIELLAFLDFLEINDDKEES